MKNHSQPAVVDIFCGIGGLSHGFFLEGFNVVAGIDNDPTCEFAFKENNDAKFICDDIKNLTVAKIKKLYPKNSIKILVGCAPCQPFSKYTSGFKTKELDSKWQLLKSFTKIIEGVQPDIVSMENVPQLAKYDKNKVYSDFINTLLKNGYHISDPHKIVYCPEYGVPQHRKRLVVLASKFGEIELIPPIYHQDNFLTVRTAIGGLPRIEDGEALESDPFHRSQKLSPLNKERMRNTTEGGSWRDWPDRLKLECHKNLSGSEFHDVYGRMKWDGQAPTLTTHCTGLGNGRFGHPEQDRAISLREAAILQSFPPKYKFDIRNDNNKLTLADYQRHIGNAVPVALGQAIAKSIKQHLQNHLESHGYKKTSHPRKDEISR